MQPIGTEYRFGDRDLAEVGEAAVDATHERQDVAAERGAILLVDDRQFVVAGTHRQTPHLALTRQLTQFVEFAA